MLKCASCSEEFRDGAQCSVCLGRFDFACAGVKESGYRRLGENRQSSWKCSSCKNARSACPLPPPVNPTTSKSSVPADMDAVLAELKRLSVQVALLPGLDASIKTIKSELSDVKSSIEFVDRKFDSLSAKILEMEKDIKSLQKTKNDVDYLQLRVEKIEAQNREYEQRSRLNNIEIKGVPVSSSENLFDVISKIGTHIKCAISKEQINYIARIPMRNSKENKSIVVAVHSRYIKDDFVSAAKKCTITAANLGMASSSRVFINDHLTIDNKVLLNKTKELAKERGFAFTWVKGCKIFARKNPNSPIIHIRTVEDLKKF